MKNDKFEELFKNALEQFEPEVPAHLWDNIQSQIAVNPPANQAPAADGGISAGSTVSSVLKVAAAALILTGGAFLTYHLVTSNKENPKAEEITEQPIAVVSEQNDASDVEVDNPKNENDENDSTTLLVQSDDNLTNNQTVEVSQVEEDGIVSEQSIEEHSDEYAEEQIITPKVQTGGLPSGKTQIAKGSQQQSANKKQSSEVTIVEAGILADNVSGEIPLVVKFQNISAAMSYEWDFGNGRKSFEPSPTFTFEEDGDYTVKLIVTNFDGKQLEDRMEISAYLPSTLFAPDVITPNGDGLNDYFEVLGENVTNVQFKIFRTQGSVVFEGKSIYDKWDGTDIQNPEGKVYMLQVTAIGSSGKPMKPINKHLTVIRD